MHLQIHYGIYAMYTVVYIFFKKTLPQSSGSGWSALWKRLGLQALLYTLDGKVAGFFGSGSHETYRVSHKKLTTFEPILWQTLRLSWFVEMYRTRCISILQQFYRLNDLVYKFSKS